MHFRIFNVLAFSTAFLAVGCAEKKIQPLKEPLTVASLMPQYSIGPEKKSETFLDMTEEYGLLGVNGVHLYAVDVNNDRATDLVVLDDFYASPKFYLFDKKEKKFKLGENPFNEIIRASYLNFVDLNHDGTYDLIVGNLNQKTETTQYPARIYRGIVEKGKLRYEAKAILPTGIIPTASISTLDFDLDGEIDLYLSNWFTQKDDNPKPTVDFLFHGKEFNFIDVGGQLKGEYEYDKQSKTYINATPTFGASTCDVDKNGFPDILTSNSNGYYNKLWMNIDGQNFVNYANESGYGADNEGSAESKGGGNSFFSLCGDYNNDEIVDIVVGNLSKDSDPESRDKSTILTGSTKSFPPKFYRSDFYQLDEKERWSEGNRRGVWIDYNLDGLSDLLVVNSGFPPDSRLVMFEQQKDHSFIDRGLDLGINLVNPSGVVTLDINNDGLMDFISGQSKVRAGDINTRLYVFVNQTKRENKSSVRFHLQGRKSNTHGISSSVVFTTNKEKRYANVEYNYGSLPSQNEEGVYFSYNNEEPQNVEVRWSYGNEDRLGRVIPMLKKYSLRKLSGKGRHLEVNLCEDGRILMVPKDCY